MLVNEKGGEVNEGEIQFSWGRKTGVQYYVSFTYNGVHYSLYDCVYIRLDDDEPEPSIGKLVRMFETESGVKKVKVVWFFRPAEVQNWLGNIKPLPNELFLASGKGKGLFNLNVLERVCGKCSVICVSKDGRNLQPTEEETRKADYVFFRTFDVETCTLSTRFPDTIAEVELKNYFNRRKDLKLLCPAKGAESLSPNVTLEKKTQSSVKDRATGVPDASALIRKRKLESISGVKNTNLENASSVLETSVLKKKKMCDSACKLPARADHLEKNKGVITNSQMTEVSRRPNEDSIKWFKEQPWEERMPMAREKGTLVLFENLDPSFTSADVEDIVRHAFNMKVSAQMIQRGALSSPHSAGQAFAIFKSKEAAESVISDLKKRCLMLDDGRTLIAQTGALKKQSNRSVFAGHLTLDKMRYQLQRPEMRMAVSTSHHSQSNTIEYEMALEWFVLQEQSFKWWRHLYEKQQKEIAELKRKTKIPSRTMK